MKHTYKYIALLLVLALFAAVFSGCGKKEEEIYIPKPIDTTDVSLPEELKLLAEQIAENVHEVWSEGRIKDGWTYGPARDDAAKKHPCLLPYGELSESEKLEVKKGIKEGLEGLKGVVPGLTQIQVNINPLASSNCDVMLDSTLESEEALKGYAVHPAHVEVANTKVRPFTATRVCMDCEI